MLRLNRTHKKPQEGQTGGELQTRLQCPQMGLYGVVVIESLNLLFVLKSKIDEHGTCHYHFSNMQSNTNLAESFGS